MVIDALPGGGCLVLVAGASLDRIVSAFGGSSVTAGGRESLGPSDVGVRAGEAWSLAVEHNGWQGSRLEVLRRLSAGTRAVSVFWNVNGVTRFRYVVDGVVMTGIDPPSRWGVDPSGLDALGGDLPWETDPASAMVTLAGRLTGEPPLEEWVRGPLAIAGIVTPWPDDPAPLDPTLMPLTYSDPTLAWALRHAPAARLRSVALLAADGVAAEAGLPSGNDLDRLSRQIASARRKGKLTPLAAAQQESAVKARRALALPDPLFAAMTAAEKASPVLRAVLMHELGDPPPPSGSLGLSDEPGWLRSHWLGAAGRLTWHESAALEGGTTGRPTLVGRWARTLPQTPSRPSETWTLVVDDGRSDYPEPEGTLVRVRWEARGRARLFWDDLIHDPQSGPPPAELEPYLPAARPPDGPAPVVDYVPHLLAIAGRITGHPFRPEDLDEEWIDVQETHRLLT
jgi:hypothetical protein